MTTIRNRLARSAADESGVAMVVAVIMLMVIGALVSVAVAAAVQTNTSSRRDVNHINALEAAEAGLQVATYRLNMLRPDDTHCVGDAVTTPTNGVCASSTYTLGNGATYSYYMTPSLSSTDACVGTNIVASTNLSQRCVTAVGTTNGIQARAQVRVAAFNAVPLFPVPGITGTHHIVDNNSSSVYGVEATNADDGKHFTVGNNATYSGCELGPGGTQIGGTVTCSTLPSPVVLSPVDPGTSNLPLATGACGTPPGGEPAFQGQWCNDDYRITNAINGTGSPSDSISGSVSWTPSTRVLSITHPNASITLGGGVYNFCEFDVGTNNVNITLAAGVKTEIIIDSPDDPGSGCSNNCPACPGGRTGNFFANNNVTFTNPSKDPTALQIYVYGWNDGTNVISMKNNMEFQGLIYAPQSQVTLSHGSSNSDFYGAIAGRTVDLTNNFSFTWANSLGSFQARATGIFYRTAWEQCTSIAPNSSPTSGC